jgi:hypothetical protein
VAKRDRTALERVERELERIGLLLEHDKALPSVTRLVAGEPIHGSWWGHPLGHVIYELVGQLGARSGALDAKLVDGKVTYVHPRLWPAFFALAEQLAPQALSRLSPLARRLHARITERGSERVDLLAREGFARSKELTAAARELEAAILVHSSSLHTESGAHARVLQSWPAWRASRSEPIAERTASEASAELSAAVAALCHGSTRKPKLAWKLGA